MFLEWSKPHDPSVFCRMDEFMRVDMRTDLVAWTYRVLPHLAGAPPSPAHRECADLLLSERFRDRDVAVMAFRGWGKSTWMGVSYPLHQALLRPGTSILIASESGEVAQDRLRAIRRELETNAVVARILPNARGDPWSERHLRLSNGSDIRAIGQGAQIRGRGEIRPHLAILDDIEDPEHVRTEAGRKKVDDWLNQDLRPAMHAERSRIVLIETPLHPDCLIQRIVHGEDGHGTEGWICRRYPASTGRMATGEASWPQWWPMEKLTKALSCLRISKAGARAYSQEYDLEAVPDESVVFKRENFPKTAALTPADTGDMWTCLTLDPAIGENERNDFAAYAVLGVFRCGTEMGKARVLEVARGRWGFDAMLAQGYAMYRKWRCRYWCYEGTAFQRVVRPAVLRMSREVWRCPVQMVQMEATADKVSRAQGVQYLVEQGLVGWPHEALPGGKLGKRLYPDAWEEIVNFPEVAHDDQADAFVYALKAWEIYWRKAGATAAKKAAKLGHVGGIQDLANAISAKARKKSLTFGLRKKKLARDASGLF